MKFAQRRLVFMVRIHQNNFKKMSDHDFVSIMDEANGYSKFVNFARQQNKKAVWVCDDGQFGNIFILAWMVH